MPDGSMRSVIIAWIRMSLGISILLFPKYAYHIGYLPAALFILLGAFVNYKTYQFIFEASYYTKIFNYFDLVENLIGKKMRAFFNITYFLDMGSTVTLYAIVTWRLFVHILNFMELIDPDWIKDKENIKLDDEHQ